MGYYKLGEVIEENEDGSRYFTCIVVYAGSPESQAVDRIKAEGLWDIKFSTRVWFRPDSWDMMRDLYAGDRGVLIRVYTRDELAEVAEFESLLARLTEDVRNARDPEAGIQQPWRELDGGEGIYSDPPEGTPG